MTTVEVITLIISIVALLGTIIGWAVEHSLSKRRDSKNRQRDIRIQYLINAWRKVAEADTIGNDSSLTDALFDIQLLGTTQEIQQIKKVIEARFQDKYAGRELINDLRNRLRKELDLEPTDEIVLGFKVREANADNRKVVVGLQNVLKYLKQNMGK